MSAFAVYLWGFNMVLWLITAALRMRNPSAGSRVEAGLIAFLSLLLMVNAILHP